VAAYTGYHDLWKTAGKREACGYLARLLDGMTPAEATALGRDALARAESHPRCLWRLPGGTPDHPVDLEMGVRIRPPMQALIDLLKAAGWEVFVVSASAKPLVEAVAARYGIDADHVLAVRTAVRDGRLTGEVLAPVTWRQGKVDALHARNGRPPALALGDSWTDFEMLSDAGVSVLIDRGQADLREAVRARGVLVQARFEGPDVHPDCAR
jgi:HAD superfamily phosphoserine phosphatase-like hydrolase